MLRETIRNDDFHGISELQCWNNVVIIRNNVGNNVATLCCAKNRPCELSRVTSPFKSPVATDKRRERLRKR